MHVLLFFLKGMPAPTPSLLKLKTMKGTDGTALRIIPRIAAGDYMTFGMCLLQDENGVDVDVLKKKHAHDGPEGITDAIIKKWHTTSGAASTPVTRTWQHLMECLRQSGLGALAEDIDSTLVATGMKNYCYHRSRGIVLPILGPITFNCDWTGVKGARTYCIVNEATSSSTYGCYGLFLLAKNSFSRAFSPTTLSRLGTATVQKIE